MLEISNCVHHHFKWLCEEYGFRERKINPNRVLFVGPEICLKVDYNPRDGCEFLAWRRDNEDLCFGVMTAIGAIETYRGEYEDLKDLEDLRDPEKIERFIMKAADFLKGEGKLTLTGNKGLYQELSKLRFWHLGHWVEEWGKAVMMSEERIAENRRLVPHIIQLLGQPPNTKFETDKKLKGN